MYIVQTVRFCSIFFLKKDCLEKRIEKRDPPFFFNKHPSSQREVVAPADDHLGLACEGLDCREGLGVLRCRASTEYY